MLKTFEKRQKIRNLTCVYAALKHILVDSQIILAYISDETSFCHAICFHGNNFSLATVRFLKVGSAILRPCKLKAKMNQCQVFCKFHCTHVKDNKKVCY